MLEYSYYTCIYNINYYFSFYNYYLDLQDQFYA